MSCRPPAPSLTPLPLSSWAKEGCPPGCPGLARPPLARQVGVEAVMIEAEDDTPLPVAIPVEGAVTVAMEDDNGGAKSGVTVEDNTTVLGAVVGVPPELRAWVAPEVLGAPPSSSSALLGELPDPLSPSLIGGACVEGWGEEGRERW